MGGVYLNYSFSTVPFSLQPELLYTQKGYKINSITTSLNYIELPVLVNLHLFKNSPVNPKIYVGPYIAFKIRADREQGTVVPDQNHKASPVVDQKFTDRVQNTDFGISMGTEVCITKFSLGIRYNAGLTLFETQEHRKNNVISITTGIQL